MVGFRQRPLHRVALVCRSLRGDGRKCVDIADYFRGLTRPAVLLICLRIAAALPWRWAETLIHDTVRYWSAANPPDAVWALPDRLTMHKRDDYTHQKEYRLAFGIWKGVFDFENVELFILADGKGKRLNS